MRFTTGIGLCLAVLVTGSTIQGEDLPQEALDLVAAFEEDADAQRYETERKIAVQKVTLLRKLQAVQDQYTRAAKLDEAVAIRDKIRELRASILPSLPNPGNVMSLSNNIGKVYYFKVKGTVSGSVYGTQIYTGDSSIAVAAVHSGVLKNGEEGIVKVTVLPGRQNYVSSTKNGITSSQWSSYSVSFSVAEVKQFPELELNGKVKNDPPEGTPGESPDPDPAKDPDADSGADEVKPPAPDESPGEPGEAALSPTAGPVNPVPPSPKPE